MSCSFICVKPLRGVIPMPESDQRCMPVEGACVPNNSYYRKLIKQGDLQEIDCATMQPIQPTEWAGKKVGSYSHQFSGSQVLNLGALLVQSGMNNVGIYSVDVDVRTSERGIILTRAGGTEALYENDSRAWWGADDGLGNLTNATDFTLVMSDGDVVVIDWVETK